MSEVLNSKTLLNFCKSTSFLNDLDFIQKGYIKKLKKYDEHLLHIWDGIMVYFVFFFFTQAAVVQNSLDNSLSSG